VNPKTDLYYYRARYYSPKLGRFLQTDPVGAKDDLNLYGYVGNEPTNHQDSLGLCIEAEQATNDTRQTQLCQSANDLSVSSAGRNLILSEEGTTNPVREDTGGVLTVGHGHKVLPEDNLSEGDVLSQDRINAMFESDVIRAETGVRSLVGDTPLSQEEFDALVDLTFNVGIGTLAHESPKLNEAIQSGDYDRMGSELKYTLDAKKQQQPGLVTRSNRREQVFRNGDYSDPRQR
jgi:GH24 family phage-related lysozyme (muramidase)